MSVPPSRELRLERRPTGLAGALLTAAVLTTAGCASGPSPWKVTPVFEVAHAAPISESAAYLAMAHRFEAEGRMDAALRAFRMAAHAAPGQADAHHDLGVALAQQGHLDEGVVTLRRAADLAASDARVWNNLGYALALQGHPQEAIDCFQRALSLQPDYPTAQHNLSSLQENLPSATPNALEPPRAAVPTPPSQADHQAASPATLEIRNGHGVPRAASKLRQWLTQRGVAVNRLGNARPFDAPKSRIEYTAGHEAAALALADRLGGGIELVQVESETALRTDVRLTLGHDLRNYSEARLRAPAPSASVAHAAVQAPR